MSTKRKPIGKRLRFSVFHRDGFTCQYCGRTPEQDDVVLHVDHIISVKDGGTNDKENLITSCRDCNLGKSAKSVLKKNKDTRDIQEELEQTKERLEQLKELTKSRKKIQEVKKQISSIEREEILDSSHYDYSDKTIAMLLAVRKELNNDNVFFQALSITENKFLRDEGVNTSVLINYLNGVIRNLSLPKEYSEILREYNNQIFNLDRMHKKTRDFILLNADLGLEFHQEVIRIIYKFWSSKHGERYKLRDEVIEMFNMEHFTVYKSGINLQLLVCDTIVMCLEDYE